MNTSVQPVQGGIRPWMLFTSVAVMAAVVLFATGKITMPLSGNALAESNLEKAQASSAKACLRNSLTCTDENLLYIAERGLR